MDCSRRTVAFLYLAATRIFRDVGLSPFSQALSPFLLFQFAWNLHEGVTHSMVLTCLVAASLWAVHAHHRKREARGTIFCSGSSSGLG